MTGQIVAADSPHERVPLKQVRASIEAATKHFVEPAPFQVYDSEAEALSARPVKLDFVVVRGAYPGERIVAWCYTQEEALQIQEALDNA